jgi:hypothetical protein
MVMAQMMSAMAMFAIKIFVVVLILFEKKITLQTSELPNNDKTMVIL